MKSILTNRTNFGSTIKSEDRKSGSSTQQPQKYAQVGVFQKIDKTSDIPDRPQI